MKGLVCMNKIMKAVEEHVDETDKCLEAWSDGTKLLVGEGVPLEIAMDVAYSMIYQKELSRLCEEVLDAF